MTAHVLKQGRRRRLRRYDPDTDRWIDPASSSQSSGDTATSGGIPFEGGGGRFGGRSGMPYRVTRSLPGLRPAARLPA